MKVEEFLKIEAEHRKNLKNLSALMSVIFNELEKLDSDSSVHITDAQWITLGNLVGEAANLRLESLEKLIQVLKELEDKGKIEIF